MEWTHVLGIVLGNAALFLPLFLWNRSESRADWRHMDAEMKEFRQIIYEEMKDFHGRLCSIEENRSK